MGEILVHNLTSFSAPIAITAGDTYQFTGQVAGALAATLGQGGRIVAVYANVDGQSAGEDLLWKNPTNFNGTVPVQQTFTANAGAVTLRLALTAVLDAGHLGFGDFNLQHLTAGVVIRRSTYMLAGQAVAVRVTTTDPDGDSGLHYLYSDHLGSASAMQKSDGSAPIITRYLPFGGYRTAPTTQQSAISDRGFTGHKSGENGGSNDLGLIYMNARFYVSGIGRFASADTLVPDPANPQSYNRYAYVLNSPLNFIDPSGHFSREAIEQYLQNNHDNWESILADWENDAAWWSMLLIAEDGDLLAASVATVGGGAFFRFVGNGNGGLTGIYYADDPNVQASSDSSLARHFQGISLQNFFEGRWSKSTTHSLGIFGTLTTHFSEWVDWDGLIKGIGTPGLEFYSRAEPFYAFSITDEARGLVGDMFNAQFFLAGLTAQLAGAPPWVPLGIGAVGITGSGDATEAYIDWAAFQPDDLHIAMGPHHFAFRDGWMVWADHSNLMAAIDR